MTFSPQSSKPSPTTRTPARASEILPAPAPLQIFDELVRLGSSVNVGEGGLEAKIHPPFIGNRQEGLLRPPTARGVHAGHAHCGSPQVGSSSQRNAVPEKPIVRLGIVRHDESVRLRSGIGHAEHVDTRTFEGPFIGVNTREIGYDNRAAVRYNYDEPTHATR